MTGLYKGTVGCMLCSLGLFSETFTGSRRHSQDVFPLGVSPWEWNKALHLSETQPCGAERGRRISSCRVNHVYNSDANDLWALWGLLRSSVTLFNNFTKSHYKMFTQMFTQFLLSRQKYLVCFHVFRHKSLLHGF